MSYSDGDMEKVLTFWMISSDESELDDGKPVQVVKELQWRSDN